MTDGIARSGLVNVNIGISHGEDKAVVSDEWQATDRHHFGSKKRRGNYVWTGVSFQRRPSAIKAEQR